MNNEIQIENALNEQLFFNSFSKEILVRFITIELNDFLVLEFSSIFKNDI